MSVMPAATKAQRRPRWSGAVTVPLARHIPGESKYQALVSIKAVHTLLFASIAAAVLLTLWDGMLGRPRRRTAMAGFVVVAETAIYVSNNQVCPLTPLAEQLGAQRGSVVDMFLPDWAARRIPIVAGTAALAALALNLRAGLRDRRSSRYVVSPPEREMPQPRLRSRGPLAPG